MILCRVPCSGHTAKTCLCRVPDRRHTTKVVSLPWARSAHTAKPASLIPFQRLPQTLTHHTRHTRTLLAPPRSRPPLPHASTLACRRSHARSPPHTGAPPPHARPHARPRRTPARSPARRPRHPRPHDGPAMLAPAARRRRSRPLAKGWPAGGAATPPPSPVLELGPPRSRPGSASPALATRTPTPSPPVAGRRAPGWLRPGSALAAATHVAPLVAIHRGHNRCSPRQRSLLAAATVAAPTLPVPTLDAPPTSTTSRLTVSPAVEP
ncbi:hypothetical protein PVAP13_9NG032573 [Panicum virgatum]|uniref:Uncharacterized protein n=1 Tax=Panicum virgatum TaxID=38727 RepID=A0A8T0MBJ0_PANVG|nr:hypothetical protein PVAP13_9NG032573 [Panicum virgatum]